MNLLSYLIHHNIKAEPWPKKSFSLPLLQIHRGYHREGIQENTVAAFQKAAQLGAKICECDVRLSQDQIPVIIHDADLIRISGLEHQVANLSAKELFVRANVPTLEQVLLAAEMPQYFNIELKSNKVSDSLARYVAKVIQKVNKENEVMISSFNPFALWAMQNYLPFVPRALLVTQAESAENNFFLRRMVFAPLLKLQMLNLDQNMITADFMDDLNGRIPVSAWTVNDKKRAEELIQLGVSSLITDQFLFA